MRTYTEADIRRFYTHVAVGKPDECWEWMAFVDKDGYGRFCFEGAQRQAHRFAYWFSTGIAPTGLNVCHSCDNPGCVNPKHLWLGTQQANMQDSVEKGRIAHGETHPSAILTKADVLEIRAKREAGSTLRQLADEYGVALGNIHNITSRTNWKHI